MLSCSSSIVVIENAASICSGDLANLFLLYTPDESFLNECLSLPLLTDNLKKEKDGKFCTSTDFYIYTHIYLK